MKCTKGFLPALIGVMVGVFTVMTPVDAAELPKLLMLSTPT